MTATNTEHLTESISAPSASTRRASTFDAFRRWGYLQAQLDPLGQLLPPQPVDDLLLDGPDAEDARAIYCGPIGVEFMHMPDAERRRWIAEHMEGEQESIDPQRTLQLLVRADIFEQTIQARYMGTKRFSGRL